MIAFCRNVDHWDSVGSVAKEFVMTIMYQQISFQAGRGIQGEVACPPSRHSGNEYVCSCFLSNQPRKSGAFVLQTVG